MIQPLKTQGNPKPRFFYGWYVVLACWLMIFLQYSVSFGLFFKPILEEFNWDRTTLSSVQSIGLIAFAIASPFLGRLIDRVGPRIMIMISLACQILSASLIGIASTIWHLYFARFFYWITVLPSAQVLTNRWFSRMRGMAQGILSSAMPLGTLVLTPLTQFLILAWTWRLTMLFWALVMLVVTVPLILVIRNKPGDKGLFPDGTVPGNNLKSNPATGTLISGIPENTGHTIVEAAGTRGFWMLLISQFICGIGCGFMMTHVVIFAMDMGFSAMISATSLSVQGGFNLLGVLLIGYLSDKIARKNALSLTYLIRSLSFFVLIMFVITGGNSLWVFYLAMALFGIGWFTTAPLTAGIAADLFGNLRMGTILGLTTACHMLGMAMGSFAGGAVYDLTHSYLIFFLVQCPLELVAVILVFIIRQKRIY
jgi:MFS family permease